MSEKAMKWLTSAIGKIGFLQIGGLVFLLWSPLWFGSPEGGYQLSTFVYLILASLWIPVAIWYIRQSPHRERSIIAFFVIAAIWLTFLLAIIPFQVSTMSILTVHSSNCEQSQNTYTCIIATCVLSETGERCDHSQSNGIPYKGEYTLKPFIGPIYFLTNQSVNIIPWFDPINEPPF